MKIVDFSYFIERYIAGEMSESESEWFRKELDGNSQLREELKLRRDTDLVLKNKNVMALRNKLAEIEKQRAQKVVPVISRRPAYHKYAAIVAFVVLIGSAVLYNVERTGNGDIISKYYTTYEAPSNQRSGKAEENADFTLALEFYNTHDYEHAAIFFSKVVESDPGDMQSLLLSGVSNFEDKKYPEAKRSFVKVIDDNNNLFIETAKWYLALCYIKTDEKNKAINQLQLIINEGGIYRNDAKKIIKKYE